MAHRVLLRPCLLVAGPFRPEKSLTAHGSVGAFSLLPDFAQTEEKYLRISSRTFPTQQRKDNPSVGCDKNQNKRFSNQTPRWTGNVKKSPRHRGTHGKTTRGSTSHAQEAIVLQK